MYFVSNTSMDNSIYVTNTETFIEQKILKDDLFNLIENGLLLPNDGVKVRIVHLGDGEKSLEYARRMASHSSVRVDVTVRDSIYYADIELAEYINTSKDAPNVLVQYNITTKTSSWRCNKMCCEGAGITIIGNGDKTFIYRDGKIHVISGIDTIIGVCFVNELLIVRVYSGGFKRCISLKGNAGDSFGGLTLDIKVLDGTVKHMKRLALL